MSGIELLPSLLEISLTSEFGFCLCVAYFWGCLHWMSLLFGVFGVVLILPLFVFDYLLYFFRWFRSTALFDLI
jgi:hypothetical protein